MFKSTNIGTADRLIRLIIGVVLIALPFTTVVPGLTQGYGRYAALIVGAVLIVTALVRFCPLYRLVGASTCKVR